MRRRGGQRAADEAAARPEGAVEATVGHRRPGELIIRAALSLALVALVFVLLLKNVGEIDEVGAALAGVGAGAAVLLVALTLLVQVLKSSQLSGAVPGLGIVRATVATESATAVANVIPGPTSAATRLLMLRSWGFEVEDFARAYLLTSFLTNLMVLSGPVAGAVALAIGGYQNTAMLVMALVGLAVSMAGVVLVALIMRSEAFARRVGTIAGRVVAWLQGLRHRRTERDFVAATLRFRGTVAETWHRRGVRIALAVVGTYVADCAILIVSVRAVGLDRSAAPLAGVIAAYTAVRLLTIVNITPGGVGVAEALYTSALLVVTGGDDRSQVVAAVLLFRGLTYLGPILLGGVSLLVWRLRRSWRAAPAPEGPAAAR